MKTKKLLVSILMLLTLCVCLFACGNTDDVTTTAPADEGTPVVNETTIVSQENQTEETQTQATETTQPTETVDKNTVDIETIGGVVIVGKIGMDDNGWYIQPEQPLNITYTYFTEKPSVYTEQTRIQMFDPAVDGIDKTVYIGQTVTASGTFRFYRDDFETLYFSPYTITLGKTVEKSYSAPELQLPDEPANLYDPSQPLPKYMDAMIEDNTYSYNAFMLSQETLEFMGNGFADFYVGFVDAFLNYKTEFPCPEKRYAEMLSTVIYYEFPLFNVCAESFEFFKHYDADKGMVYIQYKCDEEAFKKICTQFFDAADALLADVSPEQTDVEKAKNIYHALSTKMTYDDSALENIERKEAYYSYLHNSGVCVTFATVYNQLLTQVGIRTTQAYCNFDETMGHVWSVVTLDGKQYFCDPTFELAYDNGSGYRFFGMNYADRTADGLGADGIRYGVYYMRPMDETMIAQQSLNK